MRGSAWVMPLALLIGGVAGLTVKESGLESKRPQASTTERVRSHLDEPLPARLWEDPLAVVSQASSGSVSVRTVLEQIDKRAAETSASHSASLTLLPVLVGGGSSPAEVERRVQTRHAVLGGLESEDLVPASPDRMGVIASVSSGLSMTPFEWFRREGRSEDPNWTLVLWIDEDSLGRRPLDSLDSVVARFGQKIDCEAILGPYNSGTLVRMSRDCRGKECVPALENVRLLSPWVTASAKTLGGGAGWDPDSPLSKLHANHGPVFVRHTASDEQLLELMVEELHNRGVAGVSSNHIVLISEWDSLYARGLAETFEEVLRTENRSTEIERSEAVIQEWPRIHQRTYLRGLDGGVKPAASTGEGDVPITGRSQLDYLRRLAKDLSAKKGSVRTGTSLRPSEVKVVGLLGSDIYDKLLLLRALRPVFSNAVFFTTDLDVHFMDREESRWCRNLVVASGAGLQPVDSNQSRFKEPPVFRSSYQTSTYLAVREALGRSGVKRDLSLHLYEIARNDAVELLSREGDSEPRTERGSSVTRNLPRLLVALCSLVGFGLLLGLLFVEKWWDRNPEPSASAMRIAFLATAIVALIVLSVLAVHSHQDPWGEPVTLAGISTWPTIFIRSACCYLGVLFLYRASRRVGAGLKHVSTDFGVEEGKLHEARPRGVVAATLLGLLGGFGACIVLSKMIQTLVRAGVDEVWSTIQDWTWQNVAELLLFAAVAICGLRRYSFIDWVRLNLPLDLGLSKSWGLYATWVRAGRMGFIRVRLVIYTIIYLSVGILLFSLFPSPNQPARGLVNEATYVITLGLAVSVQAYLIFYVVDVTRALILVINYLYKRVLREDEDLSGLGEGQPVRDSQGEGPVSDARPARASEVAEVSEAGEALEGAEATEAGEASEETRVAHAGEAPEVDVGEAPEGAETPEAGEAPARDGSAEVEGAAEGGEVDQEAGSYPWWAGLCVIFVLLEVFVILSSLEALWPLWFSGVTFVTYVAQHLVSSTGSIVGLRIDYAVHPSTFDALSLPCAVLLAALLSFVLARAEKEGPVPPATDEGGGRQVEGETAPVVAGTQSPAPPQGEKTKLEQLRSLLERIRAAFNRVHGGDASESKPQGVTHQRLREAIKKTEREISQAKAELDAFEIGSGLAPASRPARRFERQELSQSIGPDERVLPEHSLTSEEQSDQGQSISPVPSETPGGDSEQEVALRARTRKLERRLEGLEARVLRLGLADELDEPALGRPEYLQLSVGLVARHSGTVGSLIYYPFVILLLMLLARQQVFDRYDWPQSLLIVFAIGFSLLLGCGLALRRTAEKMRSAFLSHIEREVFALESSIEGPRGTDSSFVAKAKSKITRYKAAANLIREESRGCFGPFAANPVLRATLIPFGGMGSIGLVELLLTRVFV